MNPLDLKLALLSLAPERGPKVLSVIDSFERAQIPSSADLTAARQVLTTARDQLQTLVKGEMPPETSEILEQAQAQLATWPIRIDPGLLSPDSAGQRTFLWIPPLTLTSNRFNIMHGGAVASFGRSIVESLYASHTQGIPHPCFMNASFYLLNPIPLGIALRVTLEIKSGTLTIHLSNPQKSLSYGTLSFSTPEEGGEPVYETTILETDMEEVLPAFPHSLAGHDNEEAPTFTAFMNGTQNRFVMPIPTISYPHAEHVIDLHSDNFSSMAGAVDRKCWGNTLRSEVHSFRPLKPDEKVYLVYQRDTQPSHPDPDIVRDLVVHLISENGEVIRRYTSSFVTHRSIAMVWASLPAKDHPRLLGSLMTSWSIVHRALERLEAQATIQDTMAGSFFKLAHGDHYSEFNTRIRESSASPRAFVHHLDRLLKGALLYTKQKGYSDIPEELNSFSTLADLWVDAMLAVFSQDNLHDNMDNNMNDELNVERAKNISQQLTDQIIAPLDAIQKGKEGSSRQKALEVHKVKNSGTLYYLQLVARAIVSLSQSEWRKSIVGK